MAESQFKPGTVVALVGYGGFGFPRPRKQTVAKVYKTGNFTLVDDDHQWRPDWNGKQANPTGKYRYAREVCEVWGAEHDQMLADRALHERWISAQAVIEKARPEMSPQIVELAEALAAALKGENS